MNQPLSPNEQIEKEVSEWVEYKGRGILQHEIEWLRESYTRIHQLGIERGRRDREAEIREKTLVIYGKLGCELLGIATCGHTLQQHKRMEEAKASAEIEGAQTGKTVCELIDLAEAPPQERNGKVIDNEV